MNRSYTKKRRISEANEKLEKRYLGEQGLKNIFTKNKPGTSSSPARKSQSQWDQEVAKGVQEVNGFYICSGKGDSRDWNYAKEIAHMNCEDAIRKFLNKTSVTLENINVEDEATFQDTAKIYYYYLTIKINKSDIS